MTNNIYRKKVKYSDIPIQAGYKMNTNKQIEKILTEILRVMDEKKYTRGGEKQKLRIAIDDCRKANVGMGATAVIEWYSHL